MSQAYWFKIEQETIDFLESLSLEERERFALPKREKIPVAIK